jgi:hypothetical protein
MLIKLSLLLSVAIVKVKRVFFVMHIIKSRLRNRMRDKHINDNFGCIR